MPVDFFEDKCKTQSNSIEFGLYDEPGNSNPAIIKETDRDSWHAEIKNSDSIPVDFYAIDNCIKVDKADGNKSKRCDGMLHYDNKISFVELKDADTGNWPSDGRKQLTAIVKIFLDDPKAEAFESIDAYICNKNRPFTSKNHYVQIDKFSQETGLTLYVQREITVS